MNNPGVNPTERIFSPETVCVPLTGVMIARAFNPAVPGTKAEVLALAVQMGAPYGKGANYVKLLPAMKARYGLSGTIMAPANALALAAQVPVVIGLSGDQFNLTPRYQSNHVIHSICVLYPSGSTGIQLDPLAPAGYQGDPFTPAELTKYGTGHQAIVFKAPKEDNVTLLTLKVFDPRPAGFAGGTYQGYDPATLTPNKKATIGAGGSSALVDATGVISPAPAWAAGGAVYRVFNGGLAGSLVAIAGLTLSPAPPPPVVDCAPAIKKAVDAVTAAYDARIAGIKSKVASGAADISDD